MKPPARSSSEASAGPASRDVSLSVDETNRLRLSLGLRPLRSRPHTQQQPNAPVCDDKASPRRHTEAHPVLRERLDRMRHARVARASSMAVPVATSSAATEEDDDDDDDTRATREDVLRRWVTGQRVAAARTPSQPLESKPRRDARPSPAPLRVHHDDSDDDDDSEEERDAVVQKPDISPAAENKPVAQSVASAVPVIESDYLPSKAPQTRLPKRRERRSKKRRRRRLHADPSPFSTTSVHNPSSQGLVQKWRAEVDAKSRGRDDGDREDGDDEDGAHYQMLLEARRRKHRLGYQNELQRIVDALRLPDGKDGDDGDDGDVVMDDDAAAEGGGRLMYGEMETFLQYLTVPEVNTGEDKEVVDTDKRVMEETCSKVSNVKESSEKQEQTDAKEVPDVVDAQPMGLSGVAGTLERLRQIGQFEKKREQSGRARDKRRNVGSDSDNDEKVRKAGSISSTYKPNVKLSYMDDNGNELTPKEAFRLLCHRFHGNAPGKNKIEKRLKKLIQNARVKKMNVGDTPLASAAALKEETRKLGSAHVVLSGSSALGQSSNVSAEQHDNGAGKSKKQVKRAHSRDEDDEGGDDDKQAPDEKVEFSIGGGGAAGAAKRRRI